MLKMEPPVISCNPPSVKTSRTSCLDIESLEFDGDTVLCRVCGDKASGFHYGVHACEGCKGFFRRSIQQKIQYRPCLKNQQCNIMRVNRNRCQYCRLKKCVAVGMSRDAVRFGRVPKKEKAKILEQMQKVNMNSQFNYLGAILQNETHVIQQTIKAHLQTCEFTHERFERFQKKSWQKPEFIDCSAQRACPLNPIPGVEQGQQRWEDFSDNFTPAIQRVVDFAKGIPGFQVLNQEDQVVLLKAGTFEVLLLRLAILFDAQTNTMLFTNGKLYKRPSTVSGNAGFLQESMFDFAERLNELKLTDEEIALFSAIIIIAADRPGLRNVEHVERIQAKLTQGLQQMMLINHPDDAALFGKLLMKIPDLRTLNTLHSEKLLGLKMKPPHLKSRNLTHQNDSIANNDSTSKHINDQEQKNATNANVIPTVPSYIPYSLNGADNGSLNAQLTSHCPVTGDEIHDKQHYDNNTPTIDNRTKLSVDRLDSSESQLLQYHLEKAKRELMMAEQKNGRSLNMSTSILMNSSMITEEKLCRKRSAIVSSNPFESMVKVARHSDMLHESPELVPSPPPPIKMRVSPNNDYINHHNHFNYSGRARASSFGERSSLCSGTLSTRSSPALNEEFQPSPNHSPKNDSSRYIYTKEDPSWPKETTDFRRWATEMFQKAFYNQMPVNFDHQRPEVQSYLCPNATRAPSNNHLENIQNRYRSVMLHLQSPVKSIHHQNSIADTINKGLIHANAVSNLKDKLLRKGIDISSKSNTVDHTSNDDKFSTMRRILTNGFTSSPVTTATASAPRYTPGSVMLPNHNFQTVTNCRPSYNVVPSIYGQYVVEEPQQQQQIPKLLSPIGLEPIQNDSTHHSAPSSPVNTDPAIKARDSSPVVETDNEKMSDDQPLNLIKKEIVLPIETDSFENIKLEVEDHEESPPN